MDHRRHYIEWGSGKPRRRTADSNWEKPRKWNANPAKLIGSEWPARKPRVFSLSLGDFFDNEVHDDWRVDAWNVIEDCTNLDWLIVTKRIGNVGKMLPPTWSRTRFDHVVLMITVANQEEADRDIPKLIEIKTAYPWLRIGLSIEPMLGAMDLGSIPDGNRGFFDLVYQHGPGHFDNQSQRIADVRIDWVIAGGESGPHARASHPNWFRSLRDQCARASVPFHFKQWGEWVDGDNLSDAELKTRKGPVEHFKLIDGVEMFRAGVKNTGRLLDGVEHNGFPS